ncbi:MAG: LacI family DNA-binding transcriptional regulator [Armatimonadetes bacterium]|nr:LacI family DNA-binding transcriptional regulator [Anaerolineae bacterium]
MAERPSIPTMVEVAEEAQVSIATVSRVINGSGGVSKKLEKRVLNAMQKLHYHPSSMASNLKRQRSMLVGIVIPILEHPAYSRMASVIEKKLFEYHYRAIICNSEEDEARENAYIEMLLRQRVEGIIINSSARNTHYLAELKNNNIPMVLFDRTLPDIPCNQVFCDNSLGGYTGIKYLVELGHRRIGVVGAPSYPEPIIRRIRGIREAIAAFGIDDDPALLVTGDTQLFDMGYEAARHLLQMENRPTAIFALTDVTAVGVMHAAAELNLKIPDDLSVIGYDDLPISAYTMPPLTTIAQPLVEMGETAVELLLQQIENPHLAPEKAVLPTSLVIRKSTAPPRL